MNEDRKKHWETVYETKSPNEVSWTQAIPETSLKFIRNSGVSKRAKIIDVGGGDSKLVDFLLDDGFENITVLDISAKSLERAKLRLGKRADLVTWIVSDIVDFEPKMVYDLWHDRAAFHFLTASDQKASYKKLVDQFVGDALIIGTFSESGPLKCSGLEISQYSAQSLATQFEPHFKLIEEVHEAHTTPFNTVQNFVFNRFKKD